MTTPDPALNPAPLVLSPLPYPPNALQPVLSEQAVRLHYEQHHARYVQKANEILARVGSPAGFSRAPALTWEKWLFNAHGAWLHELFWENLAPGGSDPSRFFVDHVGGPGAMIRLRADLLQAGLDLMGSGWAFLSNFGNGDLRVHTTQVHDYESPAGIEPVVVIDVWEHAYYLDHHADRQRYLEGLIGLIHWPVVEHRLLGRSGITPR